MSKKTKEKVAKQDEQVKIIAEDILNKRKNKIPFRIPILPLYYDAISKKIASMDNSYNVSSDCNSCGICEKICPVDNIKMENGKPNFLHQCEQCVACIQRCPKKALNYKNKTQNRGRYFHPAVTLEDMMNQRQGR